MLRLFRFLATAGYAVEFRLAVPDPLLVDIVRTDRLAGVPLGSFPGVTYDEVSIELKRGDVFVFCTDGIFEALNEEGAEFGASRLADVVSRTRDQSARAIVDAIFEETASFRGTRPQGDDMTAVAVKITA